VTVTAKQKTVLAIIVGALVAIAPSFFTYLQTSQEIREKYRQNRAEAGNGYEALAASVKDLQKTALAQHDYIVKLEGQLVLLVNLVTKLPTGSGAGSASGPVAHASVMPVPVIELPPPRPDLPAPPESFDVAQMKR